jgi:hypothetical protein
VNDGAERDYHDRAQAGKADKPWRLADSIPRRRLTARGWLYLLLGVALPLLLLCLTLDYVLYRLAKAGYAPCLSIFCL